MARTTSNEHTDNILKEYYGTMPVNVLAKEVNRSETFVKIRLRQLELIQPRELIDFFIVESRRKQGDISWNKGKKQNDYMSPEAIEKTKYFKKNFTKNPERVYVNKETGKIFAGNNGRIALEKPLEGLSLLHYYWVGEIGIFKIYELKPELKQTDRIF
jgi:hypothetical protein